jgi:hypothetical protein
MELKSGKVRTGLCHYVGLSMLPPNASTVQCTCGATLRSGNINHPMPCQTLATQTTLRHGILTWIFAWLCTGPGSPPPSSLGSAVFPLLAVPAPLPMAPASRSSLGEYLLALPQGISSVDVSIIPPPLHQHPLGGSGYCRSSSSQKGPTGAGSLLASGAQWLHVHPVFG